MPTDLRDDPTGVSQRGVPRSLELTIGSTWLTASGRALGDDLLEWPPDIFAFTHLVLDRSEAYRFAISPPAGQQWPPIRTPRWSEAVASTGQRWCHWSHDRGEEPPDLVVHEWQVVRNAADTPLDEVASGQAWRVCEALLTLHAIADQACADLTVPTSLVEGAGISLRARTRELLARSGSMARIHPGLLRVLPKYRTPYGGITSRSISRYVCVAGPAVDINVNQVGARPPDPEHSQLNILLLPWPLQVSASDFQPLPDSIQERDVEPYGYFGFNPSEPFDVTLADRLLTAAAAHTNQVDIVVLPESSLLQNDLARLETVLSRHGVRMLVAGIRESVDSGRPFTSNWIHFGASLDGQWWHYRQDKHHPWSLNRSQIDQYHLEDVLDPRVRWCEAMEVRRRSVQLMEDSDGLTVASLICEDLAHIDEAVDLLRAVGPSLIVALLLDGPQLESRWTARYASVLADDPGSAVLTLSPHGMVRRTWRGDRSPSSVVALWKDRARHVHEIALDANAQGILLTAACDPTIRRAADGRSPEANVTDLRIATITQIRATEKLPAAAPPEEMLKRPLPLPSSELSVLLGWSDALAGALATAPDRVNAVLDDARPGAGWRSGLNLSQPTAILGQALEALANTVGTATNEMTTLTAPGDTAAFDNAADRDAPQARLATTALRSVLPSPRR